MKIQTERLILRPFEAKDIEDVYKIYSQPEVCKYLLYGAWKEEEEKEIKFNKKLSNTQLQTTLSIACEYQGKVIGDISAWYTDMKETVEIGYAFHPGYQQQGFAKEAMKAILSYLFTNYKIHRIQANLDARNVSSSKLCESIGMRQEAHFIQDYWNKGEWTDSFIYALLETEFHP